MTSKEDFSYTNPENSISSQATPTNEATYDFDYDDNVWLDSVQNTSDNLIYNGDYIYDENGNVLNVDYEEFHWTNGRELERIDYHMLNDNRIVYASYTYDENGLRTSKTRSDYTTKYIYDGDKLLAEFEEYTVNGTCWHCKEYLYDGNDEMVGYTCDNNLFFFLKDAEGDVIGLVDSSNGNVVEKYSYDPWGAVTGANANSQRYNSIYYRGYYYDIDDSRYYLQSRYYKHQWGSFINADLPEIAQQSKNEVNGLNLFIYCNNDPVNNVDPTGYSKKSISLLLIYQNIFKGTANAALTYTRKLYLEKHYNVKCKSVGINSANDFITAWNRNLNNNIVLILSHGKSSGQFALPYNGRTTVNNTIQNNIHYSKNTKLVINICCYGGINSTNSASTILAKNISGIVFSSDNTITSYCLSPYLIERVHKANWTVHQYNWNKKRIIVTKDKFDRFLTLKKLLKTVSKRWGLKIW